METRKPNVRCYSARGKIHFQHFLGVSFELFLDLLHLELVHLAGAWGGKKGGAAPREASARHLSAQWLAIEQWTGEFAWAILRGTFGRSYDDAAFPHPP